MGRIKPGGLCWSGDCSKSGIIPIGCDQNGNECMVCAGCNARIRGALVEQMVEQMRKEFPAFWRSSDELARMRHDFVRTKTVHKIMEDALRPKKEPK